MTIELDATGIGLPDTLDAALSEDWLTAALAPISNGQPVTAIETVEVLRTMATKARFRAELADGTQARLCLKAFLDVDETTARAGPTMVHEADFYLKIAPQVGARVPPCKIAVVDRNNPRALILMDDLVAEGARFGTPHDDFTVDQVAADLEQLARLHQGSALLEQAPWIRRRLGDLAQAKYVPVPQLQDLLDGPRGEPLRDQTRDAGRLVAGLSALAERDAKRPQFLIHGDSHGGNIYRDAAGNPGLIDWQLLQRGGWALDVAYHVVAVLPADVAERTERELLAHYLDLMRTAGWVMPDAELAWREYREATLYGYYLWAITRRVASDIIELFVERLGKAVERHASFALVGA